MSALQHDTLDVDLAVIGYGKAGKTLAATLGRRGWHVAMIEQSADMYGGTCINIGCVPTKSFVHQGEILPPGDGSHPYEYTEAARVTKELTTGMRAANLAMLTGLNTVTVLTGRAHFTDAHTIAVDTDGGHTAVVHAAHVVIGTGAVPVIPDIAGLRTNPVVMTSTDLLANTRLPERLAIIGGGYVGLEFAAMYARFGAQVTVIDHAPRILAHEDEDIAAGVSTLLAGLGVTVLTGALVTEVADRPGPATVHYTREGSAGSVTADAVLIAAGRVPATEGLGLDKAGVHTTAAGAIAVDSRLRTNQPHIFAVGDVNGGPQFTYISLDDHRIVLDQLIGDGTRSTDDRVAVPYTVFTTPPLSRVGLTETQARASGRPVKVASAAVSALTTVARAQIVGVPDGLMKVVVDADTDHLLGAALLSYDSHEVINTVALAMRHGITATSLRDSIYTHPSMTEAFNQLLGQLA
ncbi:pyridine nucleotide-disulfide oxidoreductase [Mycolicibacterium conceptionense]|uniref:Pyridine nucleotide-disulfide oxidoreductase n=1 Tax=Mycolicibacterium conceptionense TaxID=451644 RepID=A0A1A1VJ63_9MYCO|nr:MULTISPECIES: FAD-dependent oxidoreductase [Mycolicibacterium]MCW1823679.1 NAD(P)/FAD-dependent oxidoreductase [Mycolicibacterium senegalense]OBB05151.1 pyridine nucleotide-disulfide oxidoreductase [Mycolicibacterium conceptionense]OBE94405.1 pyridine nucleotide-disulfide oxidoreductase [Mycolicibacterium conceptionense]OBF22251.1 pyridine nucleotide-disulfide oxidoreductase [Mycolicibacterium conceptionense]OBF39836.1 pyridine nucleotide-disulfide oxidoreductase [Mycolicibacterium concepti